MTSNSDLSTADLAQPGGGRRDDRSEHDTGPGGAGAGQDRDEGMTDAARGDDRQEVWSGTGATAPEGESTEHGNRVMGGQGMADEGMGGEGMAGRDMGDQGMAGRDMGDQGMGGQGMGGRGMDDDETVRMSRTDTVRMPGAGGADGDDALGRSGGTGQAGGTGTGGMGTGGMDRDDAMGGAGGGMDRDDAMGGAGGGMDRDDAMGGAGRTGQAGGMGDSGAAGDTMDRGTAGGMTGDSGGMTGGTAGGSGAPGHDIALLDTADADGFRQRWSDAQTRFVDDPREAVRTADALVAELMQSLAQGFNSHREQLETQWNSGGEADTESLRQALQRYRSFFDRLLST
jgi:hypothetical protein